MEQQQDVYKTVMDLIKGVSSTLEKHGTSIGGLLKIIDNQQKQIALIHERVETLERTRPERKSTWRFW